MSRIVEHAGTTLLIRFPFDRRLVERVKALPDRRWNPLDKVWTVPEGEVLAVVEALHADGFAFDDEVKRLYESAGGTLVLSGRAPAPPRGPTLFDAVADDPSPAPAANTDYTVARLNREVKAVLEAAFPAPVWLVGEISGFNKSAHKKHVGFSLVELSPSGGRLAEVGAILFQDARRAIEAKLAAAGDPFRLEDEIEVRLLVKVDLYDAWGQYRVRVDDLDVLYTLGEAARRREEIVRRLGAEGLLERNLALPMPDLPLRVGLVTSLGSDAMNDVLKTLRESGFAFEVTVHGARVQGKATEPSVLNALDRFRAMGDALDVVLICRGGGSRTDLAWFDSEALGRAVALFPIPVIVGIGHEQDVSVLDHVARRAKTPTAAAQMVVAQVEAALERVETAGKEILSGAADRVAAAVRLHAERALRLARAARTALSTARNDLSRAARELPRTAVRRLDRAAVHLTHASRQLAQGARRDLAVSRRRLAEIATALRPRSARLLALVSERLDAKSRRLHLVHPARVLERGYAILRGAGRRVIATPAEAPAGTSLRAELRGGVLLARSEGPAPPPDERNDR